MRARRCASLRECRVHGGLTSAAIPSRVTHYYILRRVHVRAGRRTARMPVCVHVRKGSRVQPLFPVGFLDEGRAAKVPGYHSASYPSHVPRDIPWDML